MENEKKKKKRWCINPQTQHPHPCRVPSERSTKPGSKFVGGMSAEQRWFGEGGERTEHPSKSRPLLFISSLCFPPFLNGLHALHSTCMIYSGQEEERLSYWIRQPQAAERRFKNTGPSAKRKQKNTFDTIHNTPLVRFVLKGTLTKNVLRSFEGLSWLY